MKIALGNAAPIYVSRRKIGGAEVIQGRSRVKLSNEEMAALGRALVEMSANDAHAGNRKMAEIGTTE